MISTRWRAQRMRQGENRRRQEDKPAVVADLVLDEPLEGEEAVLSDDLCQDLFPGDATSGPELPDGPARPGCRYVAITSASSLASEAPGSAQWAIVPTQLPPERFSPKSAQARQTIWLPRSSQSAKLLLRHLDDQPVMRKGTSQRPFKVLVLDVVPSALESVYITVYVDDGVDSRQRDASLDRRDDGNLQQEIRELLRPPRVVGNGSRLVPTISKARLMYAEITHSEPLSQGVMVDQTKIIMRRARPSSTGGLNGHSLRLADYGGKLPAEKKGLNGNAVTAGQVQPKCSGSNTPSGSVVDDGCSWSSASTKFSTLDTLDNGIISLKPPSLPVIKPKWREEQHWLSGPPRELRSPSSAARRRIPNSVSTSTRASVLEEFRGAIFLVQAISQSIRNSDLHPPPSEDDDEQARVYVKASALLDVGCFSGDWVRLEIVQEADSAENAGSEPSQQPQNWRPVRIYALPEAVAVAKDESLRTAETLSHSVLRPNGTAFLPWILLSNLHEPHAVRLASLFPQHWHAANPLRSPCAPSQGAQRPPIAREVTLLRLATPFATERASQAALLAAVRAHFEEKLRLVKSGDMVAARMDWELAGLLPPTRNLAEEQPDIVELLSLSSAGPSELSMVPPYSTGFQIAWFKIGHVTLDSVDDADGSSAEVWGGAAIIDPAITRMVQAGSIVGSIPRTASSQTGNDTDANGLDIKGQDASSDVVSHPPLQQRLRQLISVTMSDAASVLGVPPLAVLLFSDHRGIGKSTLALRACADLGAHVFVIDAYDIVTGNGSGGGDVKTEALLRARAERAFSCGAKHCAILIEHIDALAADRVSTALKDIIGEARALIATTSDIDQIQPGLRALFTHEMKVSAPDERERAEVLHELLARNGVPLSPDVDVGAMAVKTAALVAGDLADVVHRATAARQSRLEALLEKLRAAAAPPAAPKPQASARDLALAGGAAARCLLAADADAGVDAARRNFSDAIGAPRIPSVRWADVGGLAHAKHALRETIALPLAHPELFARGLRRRSGVLLYGPPGTGKTLLAKAVATEFALNFFSVKGPELLNMYIGESEANVRRVFARARDARPCVVFFDELDSVAPKRGNQGDSGGVMDRIVSQLLAELDGMSSDDDGSKEEGGSGGGGGGGGGGVYVIGATNRPDLLDPALLRPGRFDKMLYLGISDTHEQQLKVLEALTRRFNLHPDLSLQRVAERLPFTYSGADMYALCADAMLKAITRTIAAVEAKAQAVQAEITVTGEEVNGGGGNSGGGAPTSDGNDGKGEAKSDGEGQTGAVLAAATTTTTTAKPMTTQYFLDHVATDADIAVVVMEQDFVAAQRELVGSVSAKELEHYQKVRRAFEKDDD